jgi:xylulokinase
MTMLGIDLGTGSVKAAVLSDDGVVLGKASRAYAVRAPRPGWAESDPAEWLEATVDVVGQVLDASGESPATVGFSGQMHGVVLVDAHLRPLRPAILWADARSARQTERMAHDLPAELMSRLGSQPVAGFAGTTLAWLRENEPEVLQRTAVVLQPKDWLRAALGGEIATEPSDASGTLLFDVASGSWSDEAIAWTGLDPALLPPVRASQSRAGIVRVAGREIPAAVGGADTACVVVGLGLGPGDGFTAVGSGSQTVRLMDSPLLDATLRTHTFCVAGEPRAGWYRIGAVQSAGLTLTAALSWFGASIDEAAAALAAGVQADDPIFVPYLSGERTPFMTPSLRGSWHGLSLATDRAAMLRSVLEGVAQAVALGVDAVQGSGEPLRSPVPLVGGGTHDPAFRQLLADATGLALAVAEAPDAAVVGAALLGSGRAANPVRVPLAAPVEPRAEASELLRERRDRMVAEVQRSLDLAGEGA